MNDDLADIERIAGSLLRQLTSGQRRSLMRRMANTLAQSQRKRIAAQRQPDGSAFAARAERRPPTAGKFAVSFLYPSGGSGAPRKVMMRSYDMQNGMMTGFDIEAGEIRSFVFDKVIKWLPVPPGQQNAGGSKLRRRGSLRRKAMFRKLASARFLRSQVDDLGFWVGFSGRAADVAQVHQHGLRDRPSLKARTITYPKRELLGATEADREAMLDALYEHMAATYSS